MKAQIELKDSEYSEIINTDELRDLRTLTYKDSDNALNTISILDTGLIINREAITHSTRVFLDTNEASYVEVDSPEGNLKIDAKVLEYCLNNDIISLVYKIDDEVKSIKIRYLGV